MISILEFENSISARLPYGKHASGSRGWTSKTDTQDTEGGLCGDMELQGKAWDSPAAAERSEAGGSH